MPRLCTRCNPARSRARATRADIVLIKRLFGRRIQRCSNDECFAQRRGSFTSVRPNQKPHQSSTVFAEMSALPAAGYFVAREIRVIDRVFFDITQFWLRYVFIAWFYFQWQPRACERNFPRRFLVSTTVCQYPGILFRQF